MIFVNWFLDLLSLAWIPMIKMSVTQLCRYQLVLWISGWHICSSCQKAAHYMCYTCTYSLCKACTKDADYLCVRENKGFCATCMKTIMLIENNDQGNKEMVNVHLCTLFLCNCFCKLSVWAICHLAELKLNLGLFSIFMIYLLAPYI